jgi:restriction endonuclease
MKRQIIENRHEFSEEKVAKNNPVIDDFAPTLDDFGHEEEYKYNNDNEQMPSTSAAALNSTAIINFISNISQQRQPQISNNNESAYSTSPTLNISQIENNNNDQPGISNSFLDITQQVLYYLSLDSYLIDY